jgi:hypothetical protein
MTDSPATLRDLEACLPEATLILARLADFKHSTHVQLFAKNVIRDGYGMQLVFSDDRGRGINP